MKWLVSPTHMHLTSVKNGGKLKVRGNRGNKVMIRWPSTTRSILKQNTTQPTNNNKQPQKNTDNKQTKHNQTQTLHRSFWWRPRCCFKWWCNCVLWKWPRLAHAFKGKKTDGLAQIRKWHDTARRLSPHSWEMYKSQISPVLTYMTSAFAEPLNSQPCHKKWYWFNWEK